MGANSPACSARSSYQPEEIQGPLSASEGGRAGAWTSSKITCAVQSLPYIRTLDHIALNHKRNKPVHATLQAVLCRRGSFDPGLATPQGTRLSQSPIAFYTTVSLAGNTLCMRRQPQKAQKLSCSSSPCSLQEVPDDL